uniref:Uncharacterized protein TCIL3000_10_13700 n=1 Tax=Trypanosoma congolense (strain IL3000) TaxID=1068625 RepID=G0UYW7_TRYCI|nr:unnamed protein product [Trypanosoma congolense IL3000]
MTFYLMCYFKKLFFFLFLVGFFLIMNNSLIFFPMFFCLAPWGRFMLLCYSLAKYICYLLFAVALFYHTTPMILPMWNTLIGKGMLVSTVTDYFCSMALLFFIVYSFAFCFSDLPYEFIVVLRNVSHLSPLPQSFVYLMSNLFTCANDTQMGPLLILFYPTCRLLLISVSATEIV